MPSDVSLALLFLLVQTGAVWFMTGFIWVMQVLHYPLYARVGVAAFAAYEQEHNRRLARLVGPGIVITVLTLIGIFIQRPAMLSILFPVTIALLLMVILLSTAGFQARAHARLNDGFDQKTLDGLVRGNWVRTAAWTVMGVIDLVMLWQLLVA